MPVVSEEFSLKEAKQIHYIPIGNMDSLNKDPALEQAKSSLGQIKQKAH
jgi:hypothetical protein